MLLVVHLSPRLVYLEGALVEQALYIGIYTMSV